MDSVENYLNLLIEVLQKISLLTVAAYLAMRWTSLREALQGSELHWRHGLIAAIFFGGLAIIGTHGGLQMDVEHGLIQTRPILETGQQLNPPIVSFRYPILMVAGLVCGPWSGLGAGMLAGLDRLLIGDYRALAAAVASVCLGFGAGLLKTAFPGFAESTKGRVIIFALLGPILEKSILLLLAANSPADAEKTIHAINLTLLPSTVSNLLGAFLMLSVMKELERERLKIEAQMQTLVAQVKSHVLGGTLTSIKFKVLDHPSRAREYIGMLAEFCNNSREYSKRNSIRLAEEIDMLNTYVSLRSLILADSVQLRFTLDTHPELNEFYLPPRSIISLVENFFDHALVGKSGLIELSITTRDIGNGLVVCVVDTGCGISPDRLSRLGKQSVTSSGSHSGSTLHTLNQIFNLAFGQKAGLNIQSQLGQGTTINIT
ncbi:MAG: LytS/YhcK type 5TM receptor domain-containing protein [Methylococcales bacterium]